MDDRLSGGVLFSYRWFGCGCDLKMIFQELLVMILTQCSRFLGSLFIHQQGRIKTPANRLKLRPQYIDLSCLNPV
jgi:hypothetical protein